MEIPLPDGLSINSSTGEITGTIGAGAAADGPYYLVTVVASNGTLTDSASFYWSGERLRELRAVQCIEMIGTAEAKTLLDKWTKGPAEARLTKEAQIASNRLGKLLELRKAKK